MIWNFLNSQSIGFSQSICFIGAFKCLSLIHLRIFSAQVNYLILVFLSSIQLISAQQPPAVVKAYSMRDISRDDPRFRKAYEAAIESQRVPAPAQKLDSIKIVQTIEVGKFLATHGKDIFMVLIPGEKLADNTEIEMALNSTGKLYEYISVSGAKRTINIFERVRPPAPPSVMTEDQFLSRMQKGEEFLVTLRADLAKCKKCNGHGRTAVFGSRPTSDSQWKVCESCNGKGEFQVPIRYRLLW
jgi:hypothetical protein